MTTIYIFRLEGGHYSVSKSDSVRRFHPPVCLVKTIENAGPFDEDKIVKELMATHGIDKVRGGSYVAETLTEAQRSVLQQELRTAGYSRHPAFGLGANLVGFPRL